MLKDSYNVIGVMSGTSLDGVDLVYATFNFKDSWHFEIIHSDTVEYSDEWHDVLQNLISNSVDELKRVDEKYTVYLSEIIKDFIQKNNIGHIDAICSHGHTALHQPEKKLTCQIGNLPQIASLLNNKVVCDFRVQDMTFGGQGAPLVPIGDKLLFSKYDYCINLGGFANVSYEFNGNRIAFDICPVNIVINRYVNQLGLEYDDRGKIASTGALNTKLLKQLNALGFYSKNPPKSLGLEWVSNQVFPVVDVLNLEVKDILRTFVEHIAIQIVSIIGDSVNKSVLITGGGAYNTFLVESIKKRTKCNIEIPSIEIIEYKEALIFGFLGVLKLRDEVNCLQSVTGASQNHSSGKIFQP